MNRVELRDISKSFGGIAALRNVTFKILPGEIHALVGENGAGKTTLMKILSGAYTKDTGHIFIDNHEVQIRNTQDSKRLGIGIIYQEFSLVPDLSVAENIFLNKYDITGFWLKWAQLNRQAEELIRSIGFRIDPAIKAGDLSIAEQQIVEIAKALSEKVRILVLDEPSAVLGSHEIQKLFDILKNLKKEGVAIIYISHHLGEIFQIADRITVLKDGISSESLQVSETDRDSVIKLMLGRSLDTMFPLRNQATGKELLRAVEIRRGDKVKGVSLSVSEGEILGIAGLVGSGRSETARVLFAADKKEKGRIFLSGKELDILSPGGAVKKGIGMVPEDRKKHGVILSLSIKENISMTNYREVSDILGFIKSKKERSITSDLIKRLSIKTNNENREVGELSGGNQQKVVLAKWLNRNCRVMIIDEPTRGVDIGAKVEIYELINDLAQKGVAVIVISSETAELTGICDRIVVMRKGEIRGELTKQEFSEEEILRLSLGINESFSAGETSERMN
ncbi:MAG TPA: sugar ABC transporter ATP-binding protein [Bacteroidales bacterium]|nr:sugar ABC transporter ATP-binding protein [Bacteroidales bacterium]